MCFMQLSIIPFKERYACGTVCGTFNFNIINVFCHLSLTSIVQKIIITPRDSSNGYQGLMRVWIKKSKVLGCRLRSRFDEKLTYFIFSLFFS